MSEFEIRDLPVESIRANVWNPNTMSESAFERLKEEIQTVGFLDPVQVVQTEDGFMLLGGEHRWRAATAIGMTSIPAVILSGEKWNDQDLQKLVTVRLNVLKGKLDPGRMAQLYDEMAQKYGEEALQQLFAYTDTSAWNQTLTAIKKGLKQAGVPQKQIDQFEKDTKDVKTVENLGHILNELMAAHGDTLVQNFMVFAYGSKEHVYYAMSDDVRKSLRVVTNYLKATGEDMDVVVGDAIKQLAAELRKKTPKKRTPKTTETPRTDDVDF